jgi:hypothetical protein
MGRRTLLGVNAAITCLVDSGVNSPKKKTGAATSESCVLTEK